MPQIVPHLQHLLKTGCDTRFPALKMGYTDLHRGGLNFSFPSFPDRPRTPANLDIGKNQASVSVDPLHWTNAKIPVEGPSKCMALGQFGPKPEILAQGLMCLVARNLTVRHGKDFRTDLSLPAINFFYLYRSHPGFLLKMVQNTSERSNICSGKNAKRGQGPRTSPESPILLLSLITIDLPGAAGKNTQIGRLGNSLPMSRFSGCGILLRPDLKDGGYAIFPRSVPGEDQYRKFGMIHDEVLSP